MSGALHTLDARLAPVDTVVASESITWMTSTSQGHLATVMGSLCWWKWIGKHYERRILADRTGAMRVYNRVWDHDGDIDLIAMFTHGNDGKGRFTEHALLHFPRTWGSSIFSLVDLDGNGDEDNDGDQKIGDPIFLPLNGTYGAIPSDYDNDGGVDLDLALSSLTFEDPGRTDLVDSWIQQAIPFILIENPTR
jgi:hypothetical protein